MSQITARDYTVDERRDDWHLATSDSIKTGLIPRFRVYITRIKKFFFTSYANPSNLQLVLFPRKEIDRIV